MDGVGDNSRAFAVNPNHSSLLIISLGMIEHGMRMVLHVHRANQIWLGLRKFERNEYRTDDNGHNGINSKS